jgi:histidyl-tRNA synthetase
VLGANDPYLDVEVIALGWNFFQRLGLQQVHLHLNSLGEPQDRQNFVVALQTYFTANIEQLSDASKVTLAKNALRVLDSKRPEDFEIIAKAPKISDFYSEAARTHFETVLSGLRTLNIPFTVNEKLVRGLDYYRHTTFEFVGGTLDSAQNAIGGGGRYDGLVEDLGGPATAGIGFALGLDRTLLACDDEGVFASIPTNVDVYVVDTTGGNEALIITQQLRNAGISCDRSFENRSMKSQMKAADKSGALIAIIIGSDEVEANAFVLRPLRGEEQQSTIPRNDLIPSITKALS